MYTGVLSGIYLLIATIFDLLIFVFLVRLVLVASRADFYNPISQFITTVTQAIVIPLRRILPTLRNIELASILIIFLLEMIKFSLLAYIVTSHINVNGLLIAVLADSLKAVLNLFFYAILIQAIMSWIQPGHSPVSYILAKITAPIMRPFQRFIPPIAGFDISPIPAMLFLQLLVIIVANPLLFMGEAMLFR